MAAVCEKRFEYKGFPCVILMQPWAFRTGYVGLPKGHKYYEIQYYNILQDIKCHGGLTYSNSKLITQDDKDVWWIGFDCNHLGDARAFESAFELFKDNEKVTEELHRMISLDGYIYERGTICSLEYVEENCRDIVDQII